MRHSLLCRNLVEQLFNTFGSLHCRQEEEKHGTSEQLSCFDLQNVKKLRSLINMPDKHSPNPVPYVLFF